MRFFDWLIDLQRAPDLGHGQGFVCAEKRLTTEQSMFYYSECTSICLALNFYDTYLHTKGGYT